MRKRIVECVLATDMTLHAKEFQYMKIKLTTFNISAGKNVEKIFENSDKIGIFNTQQEFLNTLIHAADISNPTKPLEIYKVWVDLILEEFWQQGDKEKEKGLPVSFLCDRATVKIPHSQVGFIDGIVLPLVQVVSDFFPELKFLEDNANMNRIYYKKLRDEEDKIVRRSSKAV
jgi:cAMP-specific phosphodiesterase 4